MAMTINTNIQSLNAQRNLTSSQASLATSMQRLSSGMRINSAKDDAAGLAIAERMSSQIRGLNQAQRNANDGVSLAQTAEGALGTIGNNLQRIRELAVQSRNATNSDEDRAALQKEVDQLKSEIGRVAKDTAFNGTNLLDGSFTAQKFQVGANQGQTIEVASIANANISALGNWDSVKKNTDVSKIALDASAEIVIDAKTATADPAETATAKLSIGSVEIEVTFENHTTAAKKVKADDIAKALDAALKDQTNIKKLNDIGISVSGSLTSGNLKVTNSAYEDVDIGLEADNGTAAAIQLKSATTDLNDTLTISAATAPEVGKTGFEALDITSVDGADNAILAMDAALKSVNSARADLGAIQNRFESVVSNLSVNSENLSASKSRIMDADFASETANLSRSQILQQAGTAMVAQANQLPQGVLSLLR